MTDERRQFTKEEIEMPRQHVKPSSQVVPHITSSVSSTTLTIDAKGFFICSAAISSAMLPIRVRGWLIVVNLGSHTRLNIILSKPIIASSSGIEILCAVLVNPIRLATTPFEPNRSKARMYLIYARFIARTSRQTAFRHCGRLRFHTTLADFSRW